MADARNRAGAIVGASWLGLMIAMAGPAPAGESETIALALAEARDLGDARRGALVFADPRFACLSCHRVGDQGGGVGPDLTTAGLCLTPEHLVESILWPRRQVREGYEAVTVATRDGQVRQGYQQGAHDDAIALRMPATGEVLRLARADVEEVRADGTLMPEGLAEAMSAGQRRDLIRFLIELGRPEGASAAKIVGAGHAPAAFAHDRKPLHPEEWPSWELPVNRDRVYDFYSKEAAYFGALDEVPMLLPPFPGLDGGDQGHWGNQDEASWADGRWSRTDLGNVLSGVFRGAGVTVPKAVCVRLGDRGELSACFNPQTLRYEALWTGGFLRLEPKRHGFLDGLLLDGTPLPPPAVEAPRTPFVYQGFYRHGNRVIFAYEVDGVAWLDAPWVDESGAFTRTVGPADSHPLAHLTRGGPARWPERIETAGTLGTGRPYAVDTIVPPFENPWNALLFFGGHDFLPDGSALLCTMQGDVWRVEGLDASLARVRWRRIASGLHQALGLVVAEGRAYVLGRDQITRLDDLDGDGEADFYACASNAIGTSPAGHDFVNGLERDAEGRFYTASSKQGVVRISSDGKDAEVLATGVRNPGGLGLGPDGTITVASSEGDWVPASMVGEVRPGDHFGAGGPLDDQPPALPLVYLPRGLDNSSGGQVFVPVDDARFGPLRGQLLHFSYGTGSHFLILRDAVDGQPQGAAVPLPGEFRSGAHRGRFNPADGQLYVSGMGGWGTYTPDDGSFQRVRFTGGPVRWPIAFQAHENGVLLRFDEPLGAEAGEAGNQFAQAWNYRYGKGYGSPELSPGHPGVAGHDPLAIRSARVLGDGRSLFLEIPAIQPVSQLHIQIRGWAEARPVDLFATVHRLRGPFTGFPGYRPEERTIAAHPILADMAALAARPAPNPHAKSIPGTRTILIQADKNLTYSLKSFRARPGEAIRLQFANPDVVPHNWVLIRPGTLARVGGLANKIIAEPDAASRQYVPRTDDVLAYTDVTGPGDHGSISFRAPDEPGRYPYLCTFPGHWMVMNGEMIVE